MSIDPILQVEGLTKTFRAVHGDLTVVREVTFALAAGATCAILGPSGSGKTTLLGLCAGLDQPTSGHVVLAGHRLDRMGEDALSALRSREVGFVFQNFQLIPTLTALENVMVPQELRGDRGARPRALGLLERVGLAERADHYPVQLSGGEQQRVALARAFSNRPAILFADEPTGNLDGETGARVQDLLFDVHAVHDTCLVVVTHDVELAARCDRVIRLRDGSIVADQTLRHQPPVGV